MKTLKVQSRSYRAYQSWYCMKTRCYNKNRTSWKNYGGRGIRVCEKWNNFKGFLEDMGERPEGFSIDRIDVNGNYEKSNCRWIKNCDQAKTSRKYILNSLCIVCKKRRGTRKQRCENCYSYFRNNSRERPDVENARFYAQSQWKYQKCSSCKGEMIRDGKCPVAGQCRRCYGRNWARKRFGHKPTPWMLKDSKI